MIYTPFLNACGSDLFTYQAKDQSGALSNIATGSIAVTCLNDAPTSVNVTQASNEDTQFVFTGGSFSFIDVDSGTVIASGSILSGVTIVSLASTGILRLSGVAVSTGQVIASGSLVNLTYDPVLNGNGTPYATFTFRLTDNG